MLLLLRILLVSAVSWRTIVGAKGGIFSPWSGGGSKPFDEAEFFLSEKDLSSRASDSKRKSGGYFSGGTLPSSPASSSSTRAGKEGGDSDEDQQRRLQERQRHRMRAIQEREYDYDDRQDYSSEYRSSRRREDESERRDSSPKGAGRSFHADLNSDTIRHGGLSGLYSWTKHLPRINLRVDPVINFKLKQKITTYFGACITLGMDYLSEIAQWRAYCAVEDTIIGGRFSLRGSELGWTKSWFLNLGLGEESTAKIKLRMGLNLKSLQAYARVRFRTEPLSTFDIGEGLSCAGKLPLPGLLPIFTSLPLRVEYRLRINTPQPDFQIKRGRRDGTHISLTTGIDSIDLSLDELNFCLEWDERSPVWGIGLVKSGPQKRKEIGIVQSDRYQQSTAPPGGGSGGSGSGVSPRRGRQRESAVGEGGRIPVMGGSRLPVDSSPHSPGPPYVY